jgi:hypothetical protein
VSCRSRMISLHHSLSKLALGFTELLTEMSTRSRKIKFLGRRARDGQCVGLTTSSAICELLSRQCGILNISQSYRLLRFYNGPLLKIDTVSCLSKKYLMSNESRNHNPVISSSIDEIQNTGHKKNL